MNIHIDYLSDTVTKPSLEMRNVMHSAEVGDDVYQEDYLANKLESRVARLLGKQNACWVPSGTMANLTAVLAQCDRGSELLLGDESDMYNYEAGSPSVVGGVVLHPVVTDPNGEISLDTLENSIRDRQDYQQAPPAMLALETPHVRMGGRPLSLHYLSEVRRFCDQHNLKLHLDCARFFCAVVALGVSEKEIAKYADSLQFCFSKNMGAPAGSIVVGNSECIGKVRRWRKLLGGGMRQIGMLAAACDYALDNVNEQVSRDYETSAYFMRKLKDVAEVTVLQTQVWTNMFYFKIKQEAMPQAQFLKAMEERGIRMAELGRGRIRVVTHLHHSFEDIDETVEAIKDVVAYVKT